MLSGFAVGDPYTAGPQFPASRVVENRPRFDIWKLRRTGALTPGTETVISLQGKPVGCLRSLPASRISVELAGLKREILLTEDQPMLRVWRKWFVCPACQKRSRHLYLPELHCRLCLRLEHAVRHSRRWGSFARAAWLRRRLGCVDGQLFAEIPRPQRRGRRWRRLTVQIAQEECKLISRVQRFVAAVDKEVPDADR
jgi:hypothetical protein